MESMCKKYAYRFHFSFCRVNFRVITQSQGSNCASKGSNCASQGSNYKKRGSNSAKPGSNYIKSGLWISTGKYAIIRMKNFGVIGE